MIVPDALPQLGTLPDFQAPPSFKLQIVDRETETPTIDTEAGRASLFLSAHLFALPVSWGVCFKNVQRLQMSELAYDFQGLELFVEVLSKIPSLKRIGTVYARAAEPLFENCALEECVLCIDAAESAHYIFSSFLRCFDQKKKSGESHRIKRLGVHVGCMDGLARVPLQIEKALGAGWMHVARLLAPGGFICMSAAENSLAETMFFQLPWIAPGYFCIDQRNYELTKRVQASTPLDKQEWYYVTQPSEKPSGTLMANQQRSPKRSSSIMKAPPMATFGSDSMTSPRGNEGLSLFDCIELLTNY